MGDMATEPVFFFKMDKSKREGGGGLEHRITTLAVSYISVAYLLEMFLCITFGDEL